MQQPQQTRRSKFSQACAVEFRSALTRYNIQKQIGQGQYATVFSAINKVDKSVVAIKVYQKYTLNYMRYENLQKEIQILRQLDHPNIIKLLTVVETPTTVNLVMELGGTLSLKQSQFHDEQQIKSIVKQLLEAIQYLRVKQVIHRDIKMENILIENNIIKIIDFGFATVSEGIKQELSCGTPNYMAPELIRKTIAYSFEVDMWACGIILYFMLTKQFPFTGKDEKDLNAKILQGTFNIDLIPSDASAYLLSKMLTINPGKRIKPDVAILDTWLSPINFQSAIDAINHSEY